MGDRVAVIRKGMLQQADTPQFLYEHPVNVFVAGFIGSPAMNLVEAQIVGSDGAIAVEVGGYRLSVPPDVVAARPALKGYEGRKVIVGIRPEDMEDAELVADSPADHRITSTVELSESLGSDVVVHFMINAPPVMTEDVKELAVDVGQEALEAVEREADEGESEFVARLNPRTKVRKGEPFELVVDVTGCISSIRRTVRASTAATESLNGSRFVVGANGWRSDRRRDDNDKGRGRSERRLMMHRRCGWCIADDRLGVRRRGDQVTEPAAATRQRTRDGQGVQRHGARGERCPPGDHRRSDQPRSGVHRGVRGKRRLRGAVPDPDRGRDPRRHPVPQPGAVQEQAESGDAVSLEDLGFDIAESKAPFGEYFMSLGEFEGKHYGMPTNINLKSMIWYPKDDFDAAGYEVPTTCDDLIALSDQIEADGGTPWCVGFRVAEATRDGRPRTGWKTSCCGRRDPRCTTSGSLTRSRSTILPSWQAGELFGDVMFTDGYVLGGADQTPSIAFGDAPAPMFEDPPRCWLHRQASFINAFFPEDTEAGVDYDWFPFPRGRPARGTLFAGELAVVFSNRARGHGLPRAVHGRGSAVRDGQRSRGSSRISPNVDVGPDCYPNPILAGASEVLTGASSAGTGRFDASDQMPPQVGSGSFWTGMMRYMQDGPRFAPDGARQHRGELATE